MKRAHRPEWITVREAHARLGRAVSPSTLYMLVKRGSVEATKIAGKILIDSASLDDLVAAGRVAVLLRR